MKPRLPSPPISPLSKLTPLMRESLETLRSSLLCPLCNHVMTDPSTLTCAHSFCLECIKEYTCDHWYCPGNRWLWDASMLHWRKGKSFRQQKSSDICGCFGIEKYTICNPECTR
mmetsp:Transcript_20964/g.44065  ORF Transcript_20964/g.44065 Transcript_20964/m.44065 type:complete len:114 (-) Transcript_20964:2735-3076(-)